MEDYQLPDYLLVIGVIIALAVAITSLVRAYARSRGGQSDTSMLDKALLVGLAGLAAWVVISVLWILIDDAEALIEPVKIIGMTLVFFAVGIAAAFAVSFVFGRLLRAGRR